MVYTIRGRRQARCVTYCAWFYYTSLAVHDIIIWPNWLPAVNRFDKHNDLTMLDWRFYPVHCRFLPIHCLSARHLSFQALTGRFRRGINKQWSKDGWQHEPDTKLMTSQYKIESDSLMSLRAICKDMIQLSMRTKLKAGTVYRTRTY